MSVFVEKSLVQDFIKAAVTSKGDYYKRDVPVEYMENGGGPATKLPPISENNQLIQQSPQQGPGDFDRYVSI